MNVTEALQREMVLLEKWKKLDEQTKYDRILNKYLRMLLKITSHQYDATVKYTNLVIVAGYASFFTIWNGTRAEGFSSIPHLLSATLMGVSVTFFVFFEVYKMQWMTAVIDKNLQCINEIRSLIGSGNAEKGQRLMEDFEVEQAKHNLAIQKVGKFCLHATLIPGVLGATVLLVSVSYATFIKILSPMG